MPIVMGLRPYHYNFFMRLNMSINLESSTEGAGTPDWRFLAGTYHNLVIFGTRVPENYGPKVPKKGVWLQKPIVNDHKLVKMDDVQSKAFDVLNEC